MKTLTLNNGDTVPTMGLGTWYIGDHKETREEEIAALRYGIENGATLIDTAEMYGNGRSENLIGQAIKPFEREDLYIISKVLPNNANRRFLEESLDYSLFELNTEYLDMYLYHWRGSTPLKETVSELERMVEKGKIRSWGVSNFDIDDMEELMGVANGRNCMVNEVLYHIGSRGIEYSLKPFQDKFGIPTIAYCPLAQAGRLRSEIMSNEVVKEIGAEVNANVYQVMLAWVLAQPNTIAIPRTSRLEHMKQNIAAADLVLNNDQIYRLDREFPAPQRQVPLDIQ